MLKRVQNPLESLAVEARALSISIFYGVASAVAFLVKGFQGMLNPLKSVLSRTRAILVIVFVLVLSSTLFSVFNASPAHAAPSTYLNFQGRLLNASGSLVTDGTYNIQFNLYTVASGGSTQWTETYLVGGTPVTLKNGFFSVNLGSQTAFPSSINWNQQQWLGMTVRGTTSGCTFATTCTPADAEMTPRFQLTAVPYAFSAAAVNSGDTTAASTASANTIIQSGNTTGTTSNSGTLTVKTGDVTNGNSGALSIDVGTASGTRGTITIGNTTTNTIGIGNASAGVLTLQSGTSINFNAPTLSRTAVGTTTFDLVDGSNTTLALTNSGAGVANFTTDGNITASGTITAQTATATQDQIIIQAAAVGAARFAGTLTNADLTAARTYTLQDNSGIIPLATSANTLFFTTTGATNVTLPTSGTLCSTATCLTAEADTLATVTGRGASTATASTFSGGLNATGAGTGLAVTNDTTSGRLSVNGGTSFGTVEKFRVNTPLVVDNAASAIISTAGINNIGMVIQGVGSQVSDLLQFQDSTGTKLSLFNSAGDLRINGEVTGRNGGVSSNTILFGSGTSSNASTSTGAVTLRSGVDSGSAGTTGNVTITTGNATNATSGNTGNVIVDTGVSTGGTNGSITIGATTASALALGRVGAITTINGSNLIVNSPTAYVGNGITNATPTAFTLQSTGGSGTNIAGAGFTLAGGQGTGTGVGGNLIFQTAKAGSSGAVANVLQTVLTLGGTNGSALFQNSVDSTAGFQIQNSSSASLLTVDTINNLIVTTAHHESIGQYNNANGGIGQTQNLVTFSEQLDNAAWTKTTVTATANTIAGPDNYAGFATPVAAETLATTGAGGSVKQAYTTATTGNYTFSIWLKTASGTQSVDLRIDSTGTNAQTGTVKNVTATTTWQRFFVTQNITGPAISTIVANIFPGGTAGSTAVTEYGYGAQLNQGFQMLVYTRTTGAVQAQNQGVISNGGLFASALDLNDIPLIVQAAPSQSADVLSVQSSTSTNLFKVSSTGLATSNTGFAVGAASGQNLTCSGGTPQATITTVTGGITTAGSCTAASNLTGTGGSNQVAYFSGASTLTSGAALTYNGAQLGINNTSATVQSSFNVFANNSSNTANTLNVRGYAGEGIVIWPYDAVSRAAISVRDSTGAYISEWRMTGEFRSKDTGIGLSFLSDSTTGIGRTGASALAVYTGNSARETIDANGAVVFQNAAAAGVTPFTVTGQDSTTGLVARFTRPSAAEADIILGTVGNANAVIASEQNLLFATNQSGQSLGTTRLTLANTTGLATFTGNAIINNAAVGDVSGCGTGNYTALMYNGIGSDCAHYAFMQDNAGGTYINGATAQFISVRIANATQLTITSGAATFSGTLTVTGAIQANSYIGRGSYSSGYLAGGQSNLGATDAKSDPIYAIGSGYAPTDTALSNMYGIGYSHSNFWGAGKTSGWGLYVAAAGGITNTLGDSGIWTTGGVILDSAGAGAYSLNVGNDSLFRDVNIVNTVGIQGTSNAANGNIQFGTSGGTVQGASGAVKLVSPNGSYVFSAQDTGAYVQIGNATTNNPLCYGGFGRVEFCTSSRILKHNIVDTAYDLSTLRQLRAVQYAWNADNRQDAGFIAEEAALVVPETTEWNADGTVKSFNPDAIISVLTKSVQQLDVQVQSIDTRLSVVEAGNFSGNLHVAGYADIIGTLTVQGDTQLTTLTVSGYTKLAELTVDRLISNGSAPTAVLGANTGENGSASIDGNDTAGTLTYTAGTQKPPTNPLASGDQVTVTFAKPYTKAPRVTLTPTTDKAATIHYYVVQSADNFKIVFTDAPAAGDVYGFNYQVIQ